MPSSTRTSTLSQSSQPFSDEDNARGSFAHTNLLRNAATEQSLSEAVHARRAEFSRPQTIRIKVGTWNVAGNKGTEHDISSWFVQGKGVSEGLSGLKDTNTSEPQTEGPSDATTDHGREDFGEQEERVAHQKKNSGTAPDGDPGEVPHDQDIGLYVLGLQEIVDINSATEALRPYVDPAAATKWRAKLEEALPGGYQLIAQQQLVGLTLLIYASAKIAPQISSVSATSCGTGLMGYMGNKGAVTTRLVLGETTRLAFVNSHLSSGTGKAELDRRNWDAAQITSKTQYDPIEDSLGHVTKRREKLGDEDFAFWFGDLNYRLDGVPGGDVRKILMLHIQNEYDPGQQAAHSQEDEDSAATAEGTEDRKSEESSGSSLISSTVSALSKLTYSSTFPSGGSGRSSTDELEENYSDPGTDPTHLQATLNSLLPHDELHRQQKERKAFHDGWREGPITFLPTYKYDVGRVGIFDSGDRKRGPSWCDRILYRTRKDKMDYENTILEEQDANRKDKEYDSKGMEKAAADENMLYEYDPETDGDETQHDSNLSGTGDAPVVLNTEEGFKDLIRLEYYVSHQRVLSSDHKPLDAVFKLEYDAVIPELKSKVHQEVARDLDRAENEGRPILTLIPDHEANGDGKTVETINFSALRFEQEQTQTITLANVGRFTAFFGFLSRTQEQTQKMSPTPDWLNFSIEPTRDSDERSFTKVTKSKNDGEWSQDVQEVFSMEPGCTCALKFTAEIRTIVLARELNEKGSLDEVLVFRVKDGRDHFLHVRAGWQPTVLGRSVTELICLPDRGVRHFHRASIKEEIKASKRSSEATSSAPKELFLLAQTIETLCERIVAEWSMIRSDQEKEPPPWIKSAGWPFDGWKLESQERNRLKATIIEALDTAQPFDKTLSVDTPAIHRLEAFSQAFLLLLESLDDGVIPEELWNQTQSHLFAKDRSKNKASRDDERAAILEILSRSPPHSTLFILITSMLSSLIQEVSNTAHEDGPKDPPKSVGGFFSRRRTLSSDPRVARKQAIRKAYASIFADLLVRSLEQANARAKNTTFEQKRELIEIFLDSGNDLS